MKQPKETTVMKGDPLIVQTSITVQTSIRRALEEIAADIAMHNITENLTIKVRTNGNFRTIRVYCADKDDK